MSTQLLHLIPIVLCLFVPVFPFAGTSRSRPPPHILCCDVPSNILPILNEYERQGRANIDFISADDEGLTCRLEQNDIDAFIIRSSNTLSLDMLQRLPRRVRAVGRAGVGCDNIDLNACNEANIPVVTAAGANAVAVAEHTLALMLALARRIKPAVKSIEEGRWERPSLTGVGLRGKTVGVVGFGAIGAEVASICSNLGMKVLVAPPADESPVSPEAAEQRKQRLKKSEAIEVDCLSDLLQDSDIVSVHLPLTDSTRHYIGGDQLASMKQGATLISTARGGVVDECALLECLKNSVISGAALDVFESEGPQVCEDSVLMELAQLDSTIITPHVGGHTVEAQVDVWTLVMDRLLENLTD